MLSCINDYRPLLDAARQIAIAGRRFADIGEQVSHAAEERSLHAFESARTTQEALVILLALSRRSFYDLGRSHRLISIHESLSEAQLNWLWSNDARFWEYLSLVMRAYFLNNKNSVGESIGRSANEDPTTPVVGRVYLGVHYAEWLLTRGQHASAKTLLSKVIEQSPGHRLASRAHYWLALYHYKDNQPSIARAFLGRARANLLPRPALLSEWEIDARAGLLLQTLATDPNGIDLKLYGADFLERQSEGLQMDLTEIP